MKILIRLSLLLASLTSLVFAQTNTPNNPSWWQKYLYISSHGANNSSGSSGSFSIGPNVDVSNDFRFGSYLSLAFEPRGNVFYSYIVVFFGGGNGVNGTEMAVARSSDGGAHYPDVTFFSFDTGGNHFNDKPMITTDTNARSPF